MNRTLKKLIVIGNIELGLSKNETDRGIKINKKREVQGQVKGLGSKEIGL